MIARLRLGGLPPGHISGARVAVRLLAPLWTAPLWTAAFLLLSVPVLGTGAMAQNPQPATSGDASADATIAGTVLGRFQDRVRPLAGAFVDVRSPPDVQGPRVRLTVETDRNGRYEISRLPGGPVELEVSHPGHHPVGVTVHAVGGRVVSVDLELAASPMRLKGLEVRTDPSSSAIADPTGARAGGERADPELEVRLLEISPSLGEAGISEAVQSMPGNDPADPTDVLFMRGSTTDMKLVLLDGIPVFTPFHVAGLMRSFEPTVLGDARLHVGGAPARYDGGLTHILDLRTRSPRRDRVRMTGSLDLLSASAAAEVPLGRRAGLLASTRTLHDLGRAPLGGERPYGYGDVLVKVEGEPADEHRIRVTGFWNDESVRLDFPGDATDARWSNRAVAGNYDGDLGGAALRLTVGGSRYDAELPLQPSPTEEEPDPSPILASATSERMRVDAEVGWGAHGSVHRAGVSAERMDAGFAARSVGSEDGSTGRGRTVALGAFGETARTLAPDVSVRVGLRADVYSGAGARLSPRAALFWAVGPEAVLSLAAGRYHQVTRTPDSRVDETLTAFASDAGTAELLPVATADHVILSLDQRLTPSVALGVQGFWKRFEGLAGAREESVLSSGLDLQVLADGESGAVWLGYGLSWFWSPTDLSGTASDFAGRHLLSAGVSGALAGPFRGEARIAYGAGLPTTSLPFRSVADEAAGPGDQPLGGGLQTLSDEPSAPLPSLDESFLRLDLEIHAVFEPGWGGRPWRVRPYLRLLNALDRRDALFYTYQPWRPDAVTPLAERPILPILGVAFAF